MAKLPVQHPQDKKMQSINLNAELQGVVTETKPNTPPGQAQTELVKNIHEAIRQNQQQQNQQNPFPQGQPFDFSNCHLHIAIPCYGGQMFSSCTSSLLSFMAMAQHAGLTWSLDFMTNESLVTRARNSLAAKMMENQKSTHFMFIDADIQFDPTAILQLLADDKDIIAGLYPKKGLPINYNVNLEKRTKVQGPLYTVYTAATGFLMFKRKVYEDLCNAHPEEKYKDDIGLGQKFEPYLYNIFASYVDNDENSLSKGHLLSEDWAFCLRAKKLGYEVWVDSRIKLDHLGTYCFSGDTSKIQIKPAP